MLDGNSASEPQFAQSAPCNVNPGLNKPHFLTMGGCVPGFVLGVHHFSRGPPLPY